MTQWRTADGEEGLSAEEEEGLSAEEEEVLAAEEEKGLAAEGEEGLAAEEEEVLVVSVQELLVVASVKDVAAAERVVDVSGEVVAQEEMTECTCSALSWLVLTISIESISD